MGFQQELQAPVKAVRRIQVFSWTMVIITWIDQAKGDSGENDERVYHGTSLFGFNVVNNDVPNKYAETINQTISSMEKRFHDF